METPNLTKSPTLQDHLFSLCDRFDKELANYQSLSLPDDEVEKSEILRVLGYDADAIVRSVSATTDWVKDAVKRYATENSKLLKIRIFQDCCFMLENIRRSMSGTTEHILGIDPLISTLRGASEEDTHLIAMWRRLESAREEFSRIAMYSYRTLYDHLRG